MRKKGQSDFQIIIGLFLIGGVVLFFALFTHYEDVINEEFVMNNSTSFGIEFFNSISTGDMIIFWILFTPLIIFILTQVIKIMKRLYRNVAILIDDILDPVPPQEIKESKTKKKHTSKGYAEDFHDWAFVKEKKVKGISHGQGIKEGPGIKEYADD